MKKLLEMIALFGLACFLVAILAFSFTDSAQGRNNTVPRSNRKDMEAVQKILIDSINKLQPIKKELEDRIDSMNAKIKYNRALVLSGWRKTGKPKVIIIRDTITMPVFIPISIGDSSISQLDSLLYHIQN